MACISEQTESVSLAHGTVTPTSSHQFGRGCRLSGAIGDCKVLSCNPGARRLLGHHQACEMCPTLGLQQSSHRSIFMPSFLGYMKCSVLTQIYAPRDRCGYIFKRAVHFEKWNMSDDLISAGARHTVALHDLNQLPIQLEYLLEGRSFFSNKNQHLSWESTKNEPSERHCQKVHKTL